MCGILRKKTWRGLSLFLFVPLVCFGCGDFDTGGSDKSGSLFLIEEIDPNYFEESTRQVDVVQNPNCSGDLENPDPEPFSDHFANITFLNRPLNNSETQTASRIDLQEYEVWYEPITQGSPPLSSFNETTISDGNGIDPCDPGSDCIGETITQIEFVPLSVKDVLAPYVDELGEFQLHYKIYYRFYGVNDFGFRVSAESSTDFLVNGYDNCGGGGGG